MKCSNCNGARWVLDPEWRWWKFWVSPYTLCPECHGLNPPPNQLDDDINRWEAAFDAEERHEAMRDEPEEFQWVWDAMYDAILNQTQYTETIGLVGLYLDVCFIADTETGRCETALVGKMGAIKEQITASLKERQSLSEIMRKVNEMQGKRVLHLPGCPWPKPGDFKAALEKSSSEPVTAEDYRKRKTLVVVDECEDPTHGGIPVPDEIAEQILKEAKEIVKPVSDKCGVTDEELDAVLEKYLPESAAR